MILHLKQTVTQSEAAQIAESIQAFHIISNTTNVLITGSNVKEVPAQIESKVDQFWVFANDMQLASKSYLPANGHKGQAYRILHLRLREPIMM